LFKGTYVFKQNGVEIGRSENIITSSGRKMILQYLAGTRTNWASDMAIGAIQGTPNASDIELNFETLRFPVNLKTFAQASASHPDLIIVRATVPASVYANIYEIGLFADTKNSNAEIRNDAILVDFANITNWIVNNGEVNVTEFIPQADNSPRIGQYSVQLMPNTSYSNSSYSFSLQNYGEIDTLKILAHNAVAGNLTITMTDVSGVTTSFTYSLSTNPDYHILSVPFNSTDKYLNTISKVEFTTDNDASIVIDCVKASTTAELSVDDYIVSKSYLSVPIGKDHNIPLDIEYYVELL
jgi:hypothetical protein